MAADPETRQTRHLLGWNYMRRGDSEKALETFLKNVPASVPPYDAMTSEAIYSALMKLERYEEALVQIQKTFELWFKTNSKEDDPFTWGRVRASTGHTLIALRRFQEAETPLLEGYHQMVKFQRYQPPYKRDA